MNVSIPDLYHIFYNYTITGVGDSNLPLLRLCVILQPHILVREYLLSHDYISYPTAKFKRSHLYTYHEFTIIGIEFRDIIMEFGEL